MQLWIFGSDGEDELFDTNSSACSKLKISEKSLKTRSDSKIMIDVHDLSFIKKSSINYNDKTEKTLIYRKKGEDQFHFEFKCPKCQYANDYSGSLDTVKLRKDGKNKEFYIVKCQKCGEAFNIEKFKPGKGYGRTS